MKVTFDMTVWLTMKYKRFPTKRQIEFVRRRVLRTLSAVEHDVEVRFDGATETKERRK